MSVRQVKFLQFLKYDDKFALRDKFYSKQVRALTGTKVALKAMIYNSASKGENKVGFIQLKNLKD